MVVPVAPLESAPQPEECRVGGILCGDDTVSFHPL